MAPRSTSQARDRFLTPPTPSSSQISTKDKQVFYSIVDKLSESTLWELLAERRGWGQLPLDPSLTLY